LTIILAAFCSGLGALSAHAQSVPPASSAETPKGSRLWLVAGSTFVTMRGDCRACDEEGEPTLPVRHGPGILADVGYRVNERMDAGVEVSWASFDTALGNLRNTHLDAIAQFRPWRSHGFFLKGGAGIALVRNWVDALGPESINSKALSVVIGGGWAFRTRERVGLLLLATQHAVALGDIQTADGTVDDVMGNVWSLGAAIVFR
jgi:hypothetical protein